MLCCSCTDEAALSDQVNQHKQYTLEESDEKYLHYIILDIQISSNEEMVTFAGFEHKSRHILYTRHIVTTSSTEPYSLMKIFVVVFKIEGIVALTIEGR